MKTFSSAGTATGGLVMALGIFSQGVLAHYTETHSVGAQAWAILVAAAWILLFCSYAASVVNGSFASQHLSDPLGRFAIGTWVAGTSTFIVDEFKTFAFFHSAAWLFASFNAALWVFYVICCVRSAKEVARSRMFGKVHGVVLLSAVAVQSLVLMFKAVFGNQMWLSIVNPALVFLGVLLYAAAAGLTSYRYAGYRWGLADDWRNTNCMLHGAASITGAAALQARALPDGHVLGIWIYALCMLVLVEGIEAARGIARIRRYGWLRGVLSYDVTQWTRLFTLGMFYFFTMKSRTAFSRLAVPWVSDVQQWVVYEGAWVIILLLLIETTLLAFVKIRGPAAEPWVAKQIQQ